MLTVQRLGWYLGSYMTDRQKEVLVATVENFDKPHKGKFYASLEYYQTICFTFTRENWKNMKNDNANISTPEPLKALEMTKQLHPI